MSSGHVFVVASGFGKRVIPTAAPCRFSLEGRTRLIVELSGRVARIDSEQHHADADAGASNIADITSGPDWPAWWLETQPYRLVLPTGWTAHVSGDVNPSAFDLVGPGDGMIFVQTPRRVPDLDRMVAPGQKLVERGRFAAGDWVTCHYDGAGRQYLQRHALVFTDGLTAVVTLQCPAEHLSLVAPTHEFVCDSLQPGTRESR